MAHKPGLLHDLLQFACASRLRSAVTFAAVSFAVCHFVVMATGAAPVTGAGDLDADIPRRLIHFAAELCRFALPLAFMVVGFAMNAKSPTSQLKR
jgi:hypothetical protein